MAALLTGRPATLSEVSLSKSAVGPGLLLALWSTFAVSQLPEVAPSPQVLLNDVDFESEERLLAFLERDASRIIQLEQFFRSDPVDSPWAEATERSLVQSLNSLGLDFNQLKLSCKTQICKVASEILISGVRGAVAVHYVYPAAFEQESVPIRAGPRR